MPRFGDPPLAAVHPGPFSEDVRHTSQRTPRFTLWLTGTAGDVALDLACGGILNLPRGYRFSDEIVHVRGYDTFKQLMDSAAQDVIKCNCSDCKRKKSQ